MAKHHTNMSGSGGKTLIRYLVEREKTSCAIIAMKTFSVKHFRNRYCRTNKEMAKKYMYLRWHEMYSVQCTRSLLIYTIHHICKTNCKHENLSYITRTNEFVVCLMSLRPLGNGHFFMLPCDIAWSASQNYFDISIIRMNISCQFSVYRFQLWIGSYGLASCKTNRKHQPKWNGETIFRLTPTVIQIKADIKKWEAKIP